MSRSEVNQRRYGGARPGHDVDGDVESQSVVILAISVVSP